MSQCSDLLALLADGEPHEMRSIHRRIGFCRLNSRVAELRARGHRIVCDKAGGRYVYTLLGPLDAGAVRSVVAPAAGTPASSGPSAAGALETAPEMKEERGLLVQPVTFTAVADPQPGGPRQLTVWEAA